LLDQDSLLDDCLTPKLDADTAFVLLEFLVNFLVTEPNQLLPDADAVHQLERACRLLPFFKTFTP
jgi:hypothetical protein